MLTTAYKFDVRNFLIKTSLWSVVTLALLFGVSFLVRAFRLDFYSLWYDEVSTVSLVREGSESNALRTIINATGSETLHPLYYLMLSVWTKFAGSSVWAIRLPSVFFGSCAVIVYTFILCQAGWRKIILFVLLLIISPFLMWYSRDARPYALIMFLTGLHLLFYLKVLLNPQSKLFITGFIITGVISIYSGIFTVMLLTAELAWSFFRWKLREILAVSLVLFLALPLFWHCYRTYFYHGSERYRDLPSGNNAVRVMGIPQEFFVARSFGPTTDEVRRFPLYKVAMEKSLEVCVEAIAIICVFSSLFICIRSRKRDFSLSRHQLDVIYALTFIIFAVCLQAAMLIAITGYQMNARHIGFIFGPFFILCSLVAAYNSGRLAKILFVAPLLLLWGWSSANQLFNSSYVPEDFKNAAGIIENDERCASNVIALCNKDALYYYGVKKPIVYLRESPEVTLETVLANLKNGGPAWLVLSRPWSYENFNSEDLHNHFRILQSKSLPGINMWLIEPLLPNPKGSD